MEPFNLSSYIRMVDNLFKRKPELPYWDVEHANLGLVTEIGELLDALKKERIYGKRLDHANVLEEFGDIAFYALAGLIVVGKYRNRSLTDLAETVALLPSYSVRFGSVDPVIGWCRVITAVTLTVDMIEVRRVNEMPMDEIIADQLERTYQAILSAVAGGIEYFALGYGLMYALQDNQTKLAKRYPSGSYTDEQALARADKA